MIAKSVSDILQIIRNFTGNLDDLNPDYFDKLLVEASGNLQFEKCVAVKGESVIVKAYSKSIQKSVAVKIALPGKLSSTGRHSVINIRKKIIDAVFAGKNALPISTKAAERFKFAGRMQAYLSSELASSTYSIYGSIPPVHHSGGANGNSSLVYFVMDFIEGKSLIEWCKDKDEHEILVFFYNMVKLVEHGMHDQGIAHTDLKHDNFLVLNDLPVALDFGICKNLKADVFELTSVGEVIGTPYIIPPEMRIDAKGRNFLVDIYQLGLVLWILWAKGLPDFSAIVNVNNIDFRHEYFKSQIFDRKDMPFNGVGFIYDKMTTNLEERYEDISCVSKVLEEYLHVYRPKRRSFGSAWKEGIDDQALVPAIEHMMKGVEEMTR